MADLNKNGVEVARLYATYDEDEVNVVQLPHKGDFIRVEHSLRNNGAILERSKLVRLDGTVTTWTPWRHWIPLKEVRRMTPLGKILSHRLHNYILCTQGWRVRWNGTVR
jgi:hypothetical protein